MKKKKSGAASAKPGTALVKQARREKLSLRKRDAGAPSLAMPEKSVTEMGNLDEFLAEAELADRDFEADRNAKVFQISEATGTLVALHGGDDDGEGEDGEDGEDEDEVFRELRLTMPRRPPWTAQTTAEELDRAERTAFLEWRRATAQLEERGERHGFLPTPFEKNLQFWRQLWRVMERCDVLVQVVDARNPLLFRFADMEAYAKELSPHKRLLLLVNKADLLSEELRAAWASYFENEDMDFCFFSAHLTQAAIDGDDAKPQPSAAGDRTKIMNRQDLLRYLERCANAAARDAAARSGSAHADDVKGVVGCVGYPNVGKSSVINALIGASHLDHQAQRVSVSATPGHTKHFQTLNIGPVTLCDCPGLVFPAFVVGGKAEMICNGILPVDEIRGRDFVPALELVSQRVPRRVLEREYKMKLELPAGTVFGTVPTLLDCFCRKRGLYGQGPGRIDESRGARLLLKDFVCGRLLYCHPPPGYVVNDAGDLIDQEEEDEEDEEAAGGGSEDEDALVNEAADLMMTHTMVPIQSEEEVLFDAERGLARESLHNDVQSRRLARHGRKHKKGRDKNPYEHGTETFVAKLKGKNGREGKAYTRKAGANA